MKQPPVVKRAPSAPLRDSIERALIHHGVDYSPPSTPTYSGRAWRIQTHSGTKYYNQPEVQAYCQGLADHEARST